METNCGPESVLVMEAFRSSLELLDHGVELFSSGVDCLGHHGGHNAIEVLFDHSGHLLDRLKTQTGRPDVPFL